MIFVNQLEHKDLPYPTNLSAPEKEREMDGTVASSGCGLCSVMMMLDRLCLDGISLTDVRDLSEEIQANMNPGTDMHILGAEIARRFDLIMETSNDTDEMEKWLMTGGCVIANPGGDHEEHYGLFTHGGHYIVLIATTGAEFVVLDPSIRPDKFTEEKRQGRVRTAGRFVYVNRKELEADTENRNPRYYMFKRKSDRAE